MRLAKIHLSKRSGFTLLEVLLASLIAVLLFGGLYVAMDVELRQANEGREAIQRSTVARAIINRIAMDAAPSLAPPRASPQPTASSSTSTTGTTSSSSATSGSTASSSSASSSGASSSSSSTTTGSNTPPTNAGNSTSGVPLLVAGGLIGTSDSIIIFASRVPDPNYAPVNSTDPVPSDIRRISYWLGSGGGLCRQEIPWFSNDTFWMSNTITNETGKTDDDYVIAPEVDSLQFEFFDINTVPSGGDSDWNDYWDGTQPGPDGVTPYGPPTAIRVTFNLRLTDGNGKTEFKMYQHVIPLITSNGPNTSTTSGQ